MSDEEPEQDPDEQREAEALARALERSGRDRPPEDALETAAMLRYSRDGGALPETRREAVLEDVWAEARAPEPRAARHSWLKWALPAGGLTAAAAAALLLLRPGAAPEEVSLPAPQQDLLQTQARAASGSERDMADLDEGMRDYRGKLYSALQGRYAR